MKSQCSYNLQETSVKLQSLNENILLKTEELAELLNVSPKTVRRWRYVGDLDPIKIGSRLVRYRWGDVLKWLNEKGN